MPDLSTLAQDLMQKHVPLFTAPWRVKLDLEAAGCSASLVSPATVRCLRDVLLLPLLTPQHHLMWRMLVLLHSCSIQPSPCIRRPIMRRLMRSSPGQPSTAAAMSPEEAVEMLRFCFADLWDPEAPAPVRFIPEVLPLSRCQTCCLVLSLIYSEERQHCAMPFDEMK